MRSLFISVVSSLLLLLLPAAALPLDVSATVSIWSTSSVDSGETLAWLARKALWSSRQHLDGNCTRATMQLRPEWRTLSPDQRRAFVAAVKCVQAEPSRYVHGEVPGSTGLFEDFQAVHLNQTTTIHMTGIFLTWHRYFTHLYEQAIQRCGYPDALPYWDWSLDVDDVTRSPVFDGSDTSLGGNGAYVPHEGLVLSLPGSGSSSSIVLSPGRGGGCVETGPFAHMITRLGPVSLPSYGNTTSASNRVKAPLTANPRCLKRDLGSDAGPRFTTFRNSTRLVLDSDDVATFQGVMQGDARFVANSLGVHGGGHYIIGGDPSADAFTSPGDPTFYLHHAQVDRLYWTWQHQDFAHRQAVAGSTTFMGAPPSRNVTLDDRLDMGPLGASVTVRAMMNTGGGAPLCYGYV